LKGAKDLRDLYYRWKGHFPVINKTVDLKADLGTLWLGQSKMKYQADSSARLQLHMGDWAFPMRWRW
jgi:hypothetical protein